MSKNRRHKLHVVGSAATLDRAPIGGKVVHDKRGNAIWDWAIDTGVLARKSVAELLTSLDRPGTLSLEGDAPTVAGEWAGDPYNRSSR